jgi:hypothetical protein
MSSHSASLQELRSFGESAALLARLTAAELVLLLRSLDYSTLSVICDKFGSAVCLNLGHTLPARIPFPEIAWAGFPLS